MSSERDMQLESLAFWLTENAALDLPKLHQSYCRQLLALGLPVWRSVLGLEMLHPEQSGQQSIWTVEEAITTEAYHGVEYTADYLQSPVRVIDETDKPFRRRLDRPAADMPVLEEIRAAGATDYVIWPLPFQDRTRSAFLSFATRAKEGFSDAHLHALRRAADFFSPYAERRALRQIAVDLLKTYVGQHAGERIFNGQIQRGAVETIEAAILMCDMRGYTILSSRADRTQIVATLNAWFERIEPAIEVHGGEILKFMGDGLLAIFRAEADAVDACRRACAAARDIRTRLVGWEALGPGSPRIGGFALGLHVGEVAYGNVGGRRRLDFTVLGSAVNYASRLQDLAKRLDRPAVASAHFAARLSEPLIDLGVHPLRGIGRAERVYALP